MPRPRKFPHILSNRHGKVTVYRTRNGSYESFKIVWKEGRHRRRETRADEASAVARAEEILEDLTNGVAPRKDATSDQWAYYRRCEEMLGEVPLITAVEFYLKVQSESGKVVSASIQELVDGFIESKRAAGKSGRYIETLEHHLRPLVKVLRKPVALVTVGDLDAHLKTITNPRTRLNHRRTIVTLWRWARSKNHIPRDRETAADMTDTPTIKPKDPGIVGAEQLHTLLRAAEEKAPGIVPYIAIAAFAGVRSAEIRRMTWEEHVKLDQEILILGSDITKQRRRRVVHMEPCLVSWLKAYRGKGKVVPVNNPHDTLRRLRGEAWPHNALRHSAVSYLMALHRNAAQVADQCGHSEAELQASYKAAATPETARKWFNPKPRCPAKQTQPQDACA